MLKTFAAAVLLVAALAAPARAAGDLPIAAFAGHFTGSGIARNDLSDYFGLTVRDLDVTITPRDDGFALAWTTVIRDGGDPDNPAVRRRSMAMFFVPAGRAGVYRAAPAVDPMSGRPFAWARIRGQTLTVHTLVVTADGAYEMQTYDRTLSGAGMALTFTRVADGETIRSVSGRLVKQGD